MKPLLPSPYPRESVEQQYARVMLRRGYGRPYPVGEDRDFVSELCDVADMTFKEVAEDADDYLSGGLGMCG